MNWTLVPLRVGQIAAVAVLAAALAAPAPAQPPAPATIELQRQKWTGDLDGMIQRRVIRVLVPYSKTHYFIDKGQPRGIAYDAMKEFEKLLNEKRKLPLAQRVHVVFFPVSRDELISGVVEGRGDVALATLTITPERLKIVDFAGPTAKNMSEIVVTGPGAPNIASVDDLAGQKVYVHESSSHQSALQALNARFLREGKKPIDIAFTPDNLEADDVLEMVNAGLLKIVIADQVIAEFWKQVFPTIALHPEAAVRSGADFGWALRKDSPQFKKELDAFIATHGRGTTFGNLLLQKYLKSVKYVKNATSAAEMKKFRQVVDLFRKYGEQYGVDWLLMAAQGYQESRLDQSVKSPVGAVGVMQVMPATGKDMAVGDIGQLEANVHAGIKYMTLMMNQYYKDDPMDPLNKLLITFASYNCGPGRMRSLRAETAKRGLDPNVWFGNVERVTAEKVGQETVTYVSNIYKYYVAYKLSIEETKQREESKKQLGQGG
jgi:membrane-bound lytic murein transglycosylase MltF